MKKVTAPLFVHPIPARCEQEYKDMEKVQETWRMMISRGWHPESAEPRRYFELQEKESYE